MKKGLRFKSTIALLSAMGLLTTGPVTHAQQTSESESETTEEHSMDHSEMEHDDSGDLPEGIKEAEKPKFEVGDMAILAHGHMPGMEGAEAEIVGAFETYAYEITYEDANTGEMVKNHRWIVHEEIAESADQEDPFKEGDEITIEASHMEGMEGQTGTIDAVEKTIVYMIDYVPTDSEDEEPIKNHKWMIEEELMTEEEAETAVQESSEATEETTESGED